MRLSELVNDLLEKWLPTPEPVLPPPSYPTPAHLEDEALRGFQENVRRVQNSQIEELMEFYADVATTAADADSLDIEELLR
jgi:hypothetical protein